jgi:hypothetical protein
LFPVTSSQATSSSDIQLIMWITIGIDKKPSFFGAGLHHMTLARLGPAPLRPGLDGRSFHKMSFDGVIRSGISVSASLRVAECSTVCRCRDHQPFSFDWQFAALSIFAVRTTFSLSISWKRFMCRQEALNSHQWHNSRPSCGKNQKLVNNP